MSQQSEFEYGEQSNREERDRPTETPQQFERSEPQYQPYQGMSSGQKIYPQRRRRRRWISVLLIVLLILALLGSFSALNNTLFARTSILPQHTFIVGQEPHLVIKDEAGSVTIHTGNTGSVVVDATEHNGLFSNPSDAQLKIEQSGNTIVVDVNEPPGSIFGFGHVDLNITLPSVSDIQATVNAGSISIDGVSGQMNIRSDAGSLDFKNGTINGQSSFETNAGTITFTGALAPNGDYTFNTNAGSINLTLPSNSAFALDASTNAGSINNAFGSNSVGSNPNSKVHAHTNAGSVNVNKQ